MGILDQMNIADADFVPYLNTGSTLDLMTGKYIPGLMGSTILNGGLTSTNGVMGKPQQYKTTTILGLAANAMSRYPQSDHLIWDNEQSIKDKDRFVEMSDFYLDEPEKRAVHLQELKKRTVLTDITVYPDADTFFEQVKEIAHKKMESPKDWIVETPLIDPDTGKPRLMMIPTFITADSWSKAPVKAGVEMMDKHEVSSSETNMLFMREGLIKKKILDQVPRLAAKAGLYFLFTAHVGKKFEMNAYLPPSKDMQFMKQDEQIKGVGSNFAFLMSNLIEVRGSKVLQKDSGSKTKECEYPLPSGITSPTEMSSNCMSTIRCKNNNSGTQFFPVLSQSNGYQAGLTNYHYLRENDYFGLGTNKNNPRTVFLPDKPTRRTTVAGDLTKSYELSRAVEILAQLCFIQNSWSIYNSVVPFDITPEKLVAELTKTTYASSDILNSRGWWSYGKFDRPMLSLFDILAIITNQYKPKLFPIIAPSSGPSKKAA